MLTSNITFIKFKNLLLFEIFLFPFQQAEDVDLNAHLHGNWTLANAKSRLHQYLQQNRCPADFKYSTGGPDHNRFVSNNFVKHGGKGEKELITVFLC